MLDPAALDIIRACLGVMMLGAIVLWVMGENAPTQEQRGRDLRREHALGAHSRWRAIGCPECYP